MRTLSQSHVETYSPEPARLRLARKPVAGSDPGVRPTAARSSPTRRAGSRSPTTGSRNDERMPRDRW